MMIGEFTFLAASNAALIVEVEVQFTAGIAKPCSFAYANNLVTLSPKTTPGPPTTSKQPIFVSNLVWFLKKYMCVF